MYRLTKKFRFEASHRLPHHDGKCQRLHGHSWSVEVCVEARLTQFEGPESGMAFDFSRIKTAMAPLLEEKLDHHHLNTSLECESPTSEYVARWLFMQLDERLELPAGCKLVEVRVDETCTSACTYRGNE